MSDRSRNIVATVIFVPLLSILALSIVMMIYEGFHPRPRVPERRCVKDHSEMQVVALPGGASVGGLQVGGGIEMAPRSVCDTSAVFDTLDREIPRTRKAER